jgi:hypothetical protein
VNALRRYALAAFLLVPLLVPVCATAHPTPDEETLITVYVDALKQNATDGLYPEQFFPALQERLNGFALCSLQRHQLSANSENAEYMQEFSQDYLDFVRHYQALSDAAQRLKLMDATQAKQDYIDQVSTGLGVVRKIFEENKADPGDQATDDMYNLANHCRDLLRDVEAADAKAKKAEADG